MSTLDKRTITWHDHIDWPEPITDLGLSKIGYSGHVLHLWGKITDKKQMDETFFGKS